MKTFSFETDMICLSIGSKNSFIKIGTRETGTIFNLEAPIFEIDMKHLGGEALRFSGIENERELANGGKEVKLNFELDTSDEIQVSVYLRYFLHCPFIRYRYEINAKTPVMLTKAEGKDNIKYTGFSSKFIKDGLTEIQFSQFNPNVHSFNPNFDKKTDGELTLGCRFPGPTILLENESYCCLLSYEHGAEYPDSYLGFNTKIENNYLHIDIRAEKGNYYHGEILNTTHSFISPWFHFAICSGDKDAMFKHYRTFLLKYICENQESRKPYIFYNTWNYQERNNYFNGNKYLDSMKLDHILKEIDVAHKMGVDVYVIDTGWFNKTGDWLVNLDFFPDNLMQVKQKLDEYNMKLGLWFNPTVAAKTSEIYKSHPEYKITQDGKDFCNEIWETEESYTMCLASGFSDYFIEKMIQLNKDLGVTYFKWDGIGQYGCNSPLHDHGNETNTPEERLHCYSYKMGMEMIKIVEAVTLKCADVIVDFDVTEGGRFVGLGFLSVGKYFLLNNGPYSMDFDLPEKFEAATNKVAVNLAPYTNVFFFPGPSRSRICRQGVRYDSFVPSILFLAHFLPDAPRLSQNNSLASLMLGSNGIWGDLLSLNESDIKVFSDALNKYKLVGEHITSSYPVTRGFIGSSPEIYEKVNYEEAKGLVCFFTKSKGTYVHITGKINIKEFSHIDGADNYEITLDGRLKIIVNLDANDARYVFVF
ncbi:MAG TPA: alpha-galactosidase [Ruminiclostridium sp.]